VDKKATWFGGQTIFLEKISTTIKERKNEYEQARDRFKERRMISQEGDFIRNAKNFFEYAKSYRPGLSNSIIRTKWIDGRSIRDRIENLNYVDKCIDRENVENLQVLIKDLSNNDAVTRLLAAKKLGQSCIQDPVAIRQLERIAESQITAWGEEETSVAIIPAKYLGMIGTPVLRPLCNGIKNGNYEAKRRSIRALVETRDPSGIDVLIDLFDKNNHYRRTHINKLSKEDRFRINRGRPGGGAEWTSHFDVILFPEEGLYEGGKIVVNTKELREMALLRQYAVKSFKYFRGPKVLTVLLRALNDHDTVIQNEAAISLGYLKNPEKIPALVKALNSDEWMIRKNAALGMKYIKNSIVVDALIKNASDDNPKVLQSILLTLYVFSDPRAAGVFTKNLNHESSKIRRIASRGLAELKKNSKDISDVSPGLKTPSQHVKKRLIQKGPEAADNMLRLLKDPDPYHRWRAAKALGMMRYFGAEQQLIPLLKDENLEVKWMATMALGIIGGPNSIGPIKDNMIDKDSGIVAVAELSLKNILKRELNPFVEKW
jgi:HEAT repeat protein